MVERAATRVVRKEGNFMVTRRFSLFARATAIALLVATMLASPIGVSAATTKANAPTIGIGKPTATPDTGGSTTPTGSDADVFAAYVKENTKANNLYGPESGDLVHNSKKITSEYANLDVESFGVHVEFGNPYKATSAAGFDFGILFRLGQATHFRVIVTSNEAWYLTPGSGDPIDQGSLPNVDTSATGSNSMDLIVDGDTGYLGVNGDFVTKLDLSSTTGKGDVAIGTAFFADNFKDGATTTYKNFTVWNIKAATPTTPDKTSTKTPSKTATPEIAASPTAGEGYVSPQFGYSIAYDETWTESNAQSDKDGDYVRLSNDVSNVDISGYESTETPKACLKSEFDYFSGAESDGYTNVAIATDTDGKDMTGNVSGGVYEVITFDYASGEEDPVSYAVYVECLPIKEGESMLRIDQYVPAADYNDQIDPLTKLLKGLSIEGSGAGDVTPTAETADATPTPTTKTSDVTPTSEAGGTTGNEITFTIEDDGGTAVGLARVSENDKDATKSDVKILATGLPDGAVALIHKGTCDSFTSTPAYFLNAFDADGNSVTTVKADLAKLSGGYVMVIHESLDDLTKSYACGAIS